LGLSAGGGRPGMPFFTLLRDALVSKALTSSCGYM
jgi:hypothetical protein